jgi:hypothetical protein
VRFIMISPEEGFRLRNLTARIIEEILIRRQG